MTNNWYPGEVLTDDRYTERRVDVLAARALRAFHEWVPLDPRRAVDGRIYRRLPYGPHVEVFVIDMRSYRNANSTNTTPRERILGDRQARWLAHALATSRATWKIVAADLPIGLLVPDGTAWEAVANGTDGPPSGREAEIAWVLRSLHSRRVRNVVWLTADVHYTAAHRYSPAGAGFTEFDEFWEFVSGPLHAGGFGPNQLDTTFGPVAEFVWRRRRRTHRRWTGSSTSARSRWRRVERRCGSRCATAPVPSCGRPHWRPPADRCRLRSVSLRCRT